MKIVCVCAEWGHMILRWVHPTPAQFLLLPCSCPAQLLPFLALILAQPCFFPAPAPAHPSLAAFIIISTLRLFSARREPTFMVLFNVLIDYHQNKCWFSRVRISAGSAVCRIWHSIKDGGIWPSCPEQNFRDGWNLGLSGFHLGGKLLSISSRQFSDPCSDLSEKKNIASDGSRRSRWSWRERERKCSHDSGSAPALLQLYSATTKGIPRNGFHGLDENSDKFQLLCFLSDLDEIWYGG